MVPPGNTIEAMIRRPEPLLEKKGDKTLVKKD
jgi:hypothetical protein